MRVSAEGVRGDDPGRLQQREDDMMALMKVEARQEQEAALARQAHDAALAHAMGEGHAAEPAPGRSSELGRESEGVTRVDSGEGQRVLKRARIVPPEVSIRAAAEVQADGTTVTVRVHVRKDVKDQQVQTD